MVSGILAGVKIRNVIGGGLVGGVADHVRDSGRVARRDGPPLVAEIADKVINVEHFAPNKTNSRRSCRLSELYWLCLASARQARKLPHFTGAFQGSNRSGLKARTKALRHKGCSDENRNWIQKTLCLCVRFNMSPIVRETQMTNQTATLCLHRYGR